jgi:uncharacterized protein YndB with AHSA1/START domain
MRPTEIVVTRDFSASLEAVFDAWLDTESAALWLFSTPGGVMERVVIEARVGGGFEVIERRGDVLATHYGTYVAIDRPHNLAFDFAIERGGPSTRVSLAFEASNEGCTLTLTHAGVWADYAERTRAGWSMILDNLARSLRAA